MKRQELVKQIEAMGGVLLRHGGKHDWYHNPATRVSQPVLRHNGIRDTLAKHILKMLRSE
ncbi:MAG TPA: type II toxin-antitoxin system HicA family toxin [Candidatus Hydrogenedentes bacterium]|nr:type II toxin-antitoxin system HicA family toxin [Candidatus Hydrogenedentota bacterium]HPG68870.1 type II toxin-antitoxin system HicA family toxin [Candidatus Hydrogenedentota bacterium]